jgi:hypothetical protein
MHVGKAQELFCADFRQDQLGCAVERKQLSPDARHRCRFQLDEVVLKIRFAEVCRRTGRTKIQSNDVPENLCRNKVFRDRGDY